MAQKFYQKASVQVAIVTAIGLVLVALITIWHQRSQLKKDNGDLQLKVTAKTAEIQRLETLLTPFRTIAIEKFNKADANALKSLAETMTALQKDYAESLATITTLQVQLEKLRNKTSPRSITPEQHITLLKALKSAPKGEVSVFCDLANTEAGLYAKQIESLLKEAGFEIKKYTLSGNTYFSIGRFGTFMLIHDFKHPPSHAVALQKAFFGADIELRALEDPKIASVTNRIVIWVGQKP